LRPQSGINELEGGGFVVKVGVGQDGHRRIP
jgi:hypothetical protein